MNTALICIFCILEMLLILHLLIFENARDDSGQITGVHFWAVISNENVDIPMHLSFHFKNGKISEEYGFYNLVNFRNEVVNGITKTNEKF